MKYCSVFVGECFSFMALQSVVDLLLSFSLYLSFSLSPSLSLSLSLSLSHLAAVSSWNSLFVEGESFIPDLHRPVLLPCEIPPAMVKGNFPPLARHFLDVVCLNCQPCREPNMAPALLVQVKTLSMQRTRLLFVLWP